MIRSELIGFMSLPALFAIACVAFLMLWRVERVRHYLAYYIAATALCSIGLGLQIAYMSDTTPLVAFISGALYILCALFVTQGVSRRSGGHIGLAFLAFPAVLAIAARAWFTFVDPNLVARIFSVSFGVSVIMLIGAFRMRSLIFKRVVDRLLFWTFTAFAAHLLPRALLGIWAESGSAGWTFGASYFWGITQFGLSVLGTLLLLSMAGATLADLLDEVRVERDIDVLTGLPNRRGFMAQAEAKLRRSAKRVALLVCDVDHFKDINDSYGHPVGDRVLAGVAAVIQSVLRKADLAGRVGGEEFFILLDAADQNDAVAAAERLRGRLAEKRYLNDKPAARITVSIGVACRMRGESIDRLFARADIALYKAKREGRNRVVLAVPDDLMVPA